jgi:asparagine synthase (glutamine-hydrolysing)
MIDSIESKVQLLTIVIGDFLLSLPENFLLFDNGSTNSIFRESIEGLVPNEILELKDKLALKYLNPIGSL